MLVPFSKIILLIADTQVLSSQLTLDTYASFSFLNCSIFDAYDDSVKFTQQTPKSN